MKRIIYKSSEVSPLNTLIKALIQSWKELRNEWKECSKFFTFAVKILYGDKPFKASKDTVLRNIENAWKSLGD